MTSEAYTVQPGTLAARVLAWFADQPPACEASTGVIAAALGQPIAFVFDALEPVWKHGLIAREKRDGLHYWTTARRSLRPLGAPPVTADDDEIDDAPIVRRIVPANKPSGVSLVDVSAWSPPKEAAMSKPDATPPQTPKLRKPRAAIAVFDPLAIELKPGRPLPSTTHTPGPSRYRVLLDRMKPGDSVDLPTAIAKGLVSAAKRAQVKVAARVLSETVTGVWRL